MLFTCLKEKIEKKIFFYTQAIQTTINQFLVPRNFRDQPKNAMGAIWMTLIMRRWKKEAIFHPRIFKATYWASCALCPIDNSMKGLPLYIKTIWMTM